MRRYFSVAAITVLSFSLTTGAEAQGVKLHPLESYTTVFVQEGSMAGTYIEYCRNYCYERVQVEDFTVEMLGMKLPPQKQRTISNGAVTKTIDLTKGTVTEINNPFFADMVSRASGRGPVDAAKEYLRMSGTTETSETMQVGQWVCTIWANPSLGTRICMNDDMIPILTETSIAGVEFTRTLVEFRPNDPGPDTVYQVPENMAVNSLQVPANSPDNVKALLEALMPKN